MRTLLVILKDLIARESARLEAEAFRPYALQWMMVPIGLVSPLEIQSSPLATDEDYDPAETQTTTTVYESSLRDRIRKFARPELQG